MTRPLGSRDFIVRASQSAFMRGFIDDEPMIRISNPFSESLNPRSCAASSMTCPLSLG